MESFLVLLFFAAAATYVLSRWLGKYLKNSGIVGADVHKEGRPVRPTSGGVPVFLGFFFSTMFYLFLRTYYFGSQDATVDLLAAALSILSITFIGLLDDINVKGSIRRGLKQWQKPLLTLPAALPLMAVNLGTTTMALPLVGAVDLGLAYPLLVIPLGVMFAANMVNLLAGLNGLEAGGGAIYLTSLAVFAYVHGNLAAKVIAVAALGSVLGFLPFNLFPAKILPGDSLTYFLGAVLANVAILGNLEKFCIVLSLPFVVEGVLKVRGKFKQPTVGRVQNGKVIRNTDGVYSLPHFWMKGGHTEPQVVRRVWLIFALASVLAWLV